MKRSTIKNIGAVIGGFALIVILSSMTDTLLENIGIFPTVEEQKMNDFHVLWMNILAIAYRIAYGIIGGYCTSKLSANKPLRNVIALGVLGTVLTIAGNIMLSQMPEMADVLPLWFSIVLVMIALPSVWVGGKLAALKKNN